MILDGKLLAASIHTQIRDKVDELAAAGKRRPGLAVILVGDNPASKTYVANKDRTANQKCGFRTFNSTLPASATQAEVAGVIQGYADNSEVDGILLQLPLPNHLDSAALINLIPPHKDVDGLHPVNQGCLMTGRTGLRPCTPAGVMKLIDVAMTNGEKLADAPMADLAGKRAVVIGRSILVGKPLALMLLERNACVTIVHSKTVQPEVITQEADIVVAATGVPYLVGESWIKNGAIVIDVGINRLVDGRLTGDVDFQQVADKCTAITPVPGGVGPMTIAMLMNNTLTAYLRNN